MVGAVIQGDLDVHHRVSRDDAVLHLLLHAPVYRRDVFPGYHAADDLVDEFITGAGLLGLDPQPHVSVLSTAAALADKCRSGYPGGMHTLKAGAALMLMLFTAGCPDAGYEEEEPSYLGELERLAQLKDEGVISEEEFTAKKKQLLGI